MLAAAKKPSTPLGYHRILSPTCGLRVSPLCLGTMNFGERWKPIMGECTKENSFEILDYFYSKGGNFLDSAHNYQSGQTEEWLGEWLTSRNCRDDMVIATKFTFCHEDLDPKQIKSNYQGNHAKALKVSLEKSLRKLKTDYVDILYVHFFDFTTSIPDMMRALHRVVMAGQVLYLGISDTPAWVVSKANEYARCNGLTPFCAYQGLWNAEKRDLEREVIPMVEAEGMALTPWGPLGQGAFNLASLENQKGAGGRMAPMAATVNVPVAKVLEKIGKAKGFSSVNVALAYLMHKVPYVFPVIGGRKLEHLKSNIDALAINLEREEMREIEAAQPFDIGFPMNFLFEHDGESKYETGVSTSSDVVMLKKDYLLDTVEKPRAISAHST